MIQKRQGRLGSPFNVFTFSILTLTACYAAYRSNRFSPFLGKPFIIVML